MARNRRRRSVVALVSVAALIAASCSTDVAEPDRVAVDGEVPEGWLTQDSPAPSVIVVPENGSFDPDLMVACGGSPLFRADALVNPPLLSDSATADGALGPLDEFLAGGEGEYWPQDGYWVLVNDNDSLLIAHIDDQRGVTMLGTTQEGGEWRPTQISAGQACPVQVPLPDGLGEVEWRIDPDRPTDADATEIHLLATGRDCSSGQPMGDRLATPQVKERDDAIYLALVALRPTGPQNCPGNPEEPVTITLARPVGARPVVNARTAAGTIADYLPVSPCGHIAQESLPSPQATNEPIRLDGPATRTPCR